MRELLFVEHRDDVIAQDPADRLPAHDDLADVRFAADGGPHRLAIAAADQLHLAGGQALRQACGHLGELLRHEFEGPRVHVEGGLDVGLAIGHLHDVLDRQHARFDTQLPTNAGVAPVVARCNAEVRRLSSGAAPARRPSSGKATTPPTPAARLDFRKRRREESLLIGTSPGKISRRMRNYTSMIMRTPGAVQAGRRTIRHVFPKKRGRPRPTAPWSRRNRPAAIPVTPQD